MWVDKVDRIDTDRQKVSKHQNAYLQSVNKQKSLDFKIIGFWTWVSKKKANYNSTKKQTKKWILNETKSEMVKKFVKTYTKCILYRNLAKISQFISYLSIYEKYLA